jgi:hypothetical protein
MKKKLVYLEGMGGDAYPLNYCSVLINEDGVNCGILWGQPSCEGCPRDEVLARLGLLEPGQGGAQPSP